MDLRAAANSLYASAGWSCKLHRLVCVCLLALAAFLRLHELPAEILSFDEAVAVELATGTVGEIVSNTGRFNSSPILYPLMLAAVQMVDDSPLAGRLLSAIASILTVAALLFWLPRVGIAPGAALLAGLMATLCGDLIQHAQDAREYSIDALVATLMLIGLLKYLRGGGRALLCATLAIAPLVQYGLVLFGLAVLGTLALASHAGRGGWRERLVCLTDATACFALGAGATYALTLHLTGLDAAARGDFGTYMEAGLYRGGFADLGAMFGFAMTQFSAFASHFAPSAVAVVGGLTFAALLAHSIATRQALRAVPMLLLFTGAMALAAALLSLYPLWGHYQCIYLTPMLFVGLAHAIHAILDRLPALPRQALAGVVVVAALAETAPSVVRGFPYQERGEAELVLAALGEHVGDDPVYLSKTSVPVMDYYHPSLERQFFRGDSCHWYDNEQCAQDFVMELLNMHLDGAQRTWVVFFHWQTWHIMERWRDKGLAEHVDRIHSVNLWLIPDLAAVVSPLLRTTEQLTAFVSALADDGRQVVEHADFDVYAHARERVLIYVLGDAAPSDDVSIMLHVAPAVEQCPPVDILDFTFRGPFRLNGRPAQVVFLPVYPIAWISTGRIANDYVVELWRQGFDPELGPATRTRQWAIDSEPCRHRPESATMAVERLARLANAKLETPQADLRAEEN